MHAWRSSQGSSQKRGEPLRPSKRQCTRSEGRNAAATWRSGGATRSGRAGVALRTFFSAMLNAETQVDGDSFSAEEMPQDAEGAREVPFLLVRGGCSCVVDPLEPRSGQRKGSAPPTALKSPQRSTPKCGVWREGEGDGKGEDDGEGEGDGEID